MTRRAELDVETRPVLWVGSEERTEIAELRGAGLSVHRAVSFVAALDALEGSDFLVFVDAEELTGRESERFAALRTAGAAAVVGIYPPSLAWRAERASALGADAAIPLPAWPGVLVGTARRISAALTSPGSAANAPATATGDLFATPAATPSRRAGDLPTARPAEMSAFESLVGDVAVLHRSIENLDRMLDHALHAFTRRAAAERCSILLYDRTHVNLWVRRSTVLRDTSGVEPVIAGRGLAGHVAATGEPLRIEDVRASRFASPVPGIPDDRGYRTASCLLLPLRGAEDVVGVVCLTDKKDGTPFSEAEVPPLAFFADRAGQAIENGIKFRQLQELAAVDELTGLANRRQFQHALEQEIHRARRYDRQLTLAILDLDHFKLFNDRCGHQAGDRALAAVGEILRTSLREVDVVARYGGEEFAVILPETAARPAGPARNPFPFLERLRRRIEESHFPGAEKLPGGRLTVSGGVACFPDDANNVEDLIREADRALYVSKSRGRNTITYRGKTLAD